MQVSLCRHIKTNGLQCRGVAISRLRLLLLPQPPPPQPRPLPRQGPLPLRPDRRTPLPPAPRRRGPRIRPARHLLRHQRARHRLHRPQGGQLALLRPPARLHQRPRPAHRPPPHPARPRRLQRVLEPPSPTPAPTSPRPAAPSKSRRPNRSLPTSEFEPLPNRVPQVRRSLYLVDPGNTTRTNQRNIAARIVRTTTQRTTRNRQRTTINGRHRAAANQLDPLPHRSPRRIHRPATTISSHSNLTSNLEPRTSNLLPLRLPLLQKRRNSLAKIRRLASTVRWPRAQPQSPHPATPCSAQPSAAWLPPATAGLFAISVSASACNPLRQFLRQPPPHSPAPADAPPPHRRAGRSTADRGSACRQSAVRERPTPAPAQSRSALR